MSVTLPSENSNIESTNTEVNPFPDDAVHITGFMDQVPTYYL